MMMMNVSSHDRRICFRLSTASVGFGPNPERDDHGSLHGRSDPRRTLVGFLSDRFGRRRQSSSRSSVQSCAFPLWAYAPSLSLLVVGAFLIQFMVQGAWYIIPAHLSELSPDSVGDSLLDLLTECGVLLASSVAYIEALLAEHTVTQTPWL